MAFLEDFCPLRKLQWTSLRAVGYYFRIQIFTCVSIDDFTIMPRTVTQYKITESLAIKPEAV